MSEQDQLAALGQLAKSYGDAKKQLTLLQSEISHYAEKAVILNLAIRNKEFAKASGLLQEPSLIKYFSVESLRALLDDASATEQKLKGLQDQMTSAGLL